MFDVHGPVTVCAQTQVKTNASPPDLYWAEGSYCVRLAVVAGAARRATRAPSLHPPRPSTGNTLAVTEDLTDAQQAVVEAGLRNGVVNNLGLKLHVGDVCTPGEENSTCPVRLCLGFWHTQHTD